MTYDLAKQLKDAWFPDTQQLRYRDEGYICGIEKEEHEAKCKDYDCHSGLVAYPDPTLSELIEACVVATSNFSLVSLPSLGAWGATLDSLSIGFHDGKGATPEEAVARLWLALNKKP